MQLSEIFKQLTYGELSQLSIGGAEAGQISEANYQAVIAHIQMGLIALHKRFPLREGRMTVPLEHGKVTYPLTGDILKIERVYTDKGWELGLNDESDPYACSTPSSQMLRIPASIASGNIDVPDHFKTATLEVVYRENHPAIGASEWGIDDPDDITVDLPYSHLEPLLLFIASRVHTPTSMTNETNMGNTYAAKYEAACQEIETRNLRVDNFSQPDKILRNGWV